MNEDMRLTTEASTAGFSNNRFERSLISLTVFSQGSGQCHQSLHVCHTHKKECLLCI